MVKIDYCPNWFNIDNYNITETFSRYSWEYSMLLRHMLNENIISHEQQSQEKNLERLIEISSPEFLLTAHSMIDENSIHSVLEKEESIGDLRYGDLLCIYESLEQYEKESINHMKDIINYRNMYYKKYEDRDKHLGVHEEFPYWINYSYETVIPNNWDVLANISQHQELDAFIFVNLRNNDEEIVSDFKKWLHQTRHSKKQNNSKKISDNELSRLSLFKVLPYIDLYLWIKITGEKLTQYQVANLLYPNEFETDIKERLRACTIPRAMKLINSSVRIFRDNTK